MSERPYTQVITDKKGKRKMFKDKRKAYSCRIKKLEAEMRYLFFYAKPTGANVILYNSLEARWKLLTDYNTK